VVGGLLWKKVEKKLGQEQGGAPQPPHEAAQTILPQVRRSRQRNSETARRRKRN